MRSFRASFLKVMTWNFSFVIFFCMKWQSQVVGLVTLYPTCPQWWGILTHLSGFHQAKYIPWSCGAIQCHDKFKQISLWTLNHLQELCFSLIAWCLWLNVVRFSRDFISLCVPRSIELDRVRPNLVHDFFWIQSIGIILLEQF